MRLELVLAGDDQSVEEVEGGRLDSDHDLAGSGDGVGHIGEFKIVGCARTGAQDGFHAGSYHTGRSLSWPPDCLHIAGFLRPNLT